MKKLLLLMLATTLSTTMFAQSVGMTKGAINDEPIAPVTYVGASNGEILKMEGSYSPQKRAITTSVTYAKPAGMMFCTSLKEEFSTDYPDIPYTICLAPYFDEYKYENMNNRPLLTRWNIKTEAGTDGTDVESDTDGNYIQSLLPGEYATIPYLYGSTGSSYYNMAFYEYFNSSDVKGEYLHYVVGSGYNGGCRWMGWYENKYSYKRVYSTVFDGNYILGSQNYKLNDFTVTDKDGNKKVISATFPCRGLKQNFYAPASPLYAECIGFWGCTTKNVEDETYQPLENGAVLTMNIYDQDTGELMETLTATTGDWTPFELYSQEGSFVAMREGFLKFTKKVNDEIVPVVIDRAITLEITGLDNENVSVGSYTHPFNTNNVADEGIGQAYVMFSDPSGEYEIEDVDASTHAICTEPYLSIHVYGIMDKVYTTEGFNNLEVSADGKTCSNENIGSEFNLGGAHVKTALPWINETTGEENYTIEEGLPDWLTMECKAYGEAKNEYIVSFTAEVNDSGNDRSVTIHLQGMGFTDPTPITITQLADNGGSGGEVFVEANDDEIDITYQVVSSVELTCEVIYGFDYTYTGDVNIPEKVVHNGLTYTVVAIGNSAFYQCTGVTSVTIPSSVTEIKDGAFYGCSRITSLDIPENLTKIGDSAFYNCSGITSMTLPDGITTIGDDAFYACRGMTSFNVPKNLTAISTEMLYMCQGLKSIDIPEDAIMTEIGYQAFAMCTSLPGSLTIPANVTTMGERTFYNCVALESIYFASDDKMTSIPNYCFGYCTKLTEVNVPQSVTSIGASAFYSCSQITSLDFSECNDLTYIGGYAFQKCSALTDIKLPKSLTFIDWCALLECTNLMSISSYNPEPPVCSDYTVITNGHDTQVFGEVDTENCIVYVPAGSKEAYSTADQWKDFANIVEMDDDDTTTGINGISLDSENVEGIYSTSGQKLNTTMKGVNIIRYTDGTVKKIYVK